MKDSKVRLLELMLFKEVGGTGYDLAIDVLAKEWPDYYYRLCNQLEGIKDS